MACSSWPQMNSTDVQPLQLCHLLRDHNYRRVGHHPCGLSPLAALLYMPVLHESSWASCQPRGHHGISLLAAHLQSSVNSASVEHMATEKSW